MDNALHTSLLWRILCAIGGFLRRTAQSSRILSGIGRVWRESRTRAVLARFLLSDPVWTQSSGLKRLLDRCNARLAGWTRARSCLEDSVLGKAANAVFRWGRGSRILGWLFAGGMTSVLLVLLALYAGIDYVLRDVLSIPVVSSGWDEALLIFCVFWVIRQRTGRAAPLPSRLHPLDVSVLGYFVVAFCLMCVVAPYPAIQLTGFRASAQYLLWFFVVTRLIRDRHDLLTLYLTFLALATAIALHGIYQYIVKVPIPASWMTHSETAVRTRVYSIFGSPNIMGDFMVMFAPMAAGLAYYTKNRKLQIAAWVCAVLMGVGCLFTMSKASWAAMALAVVIFVALVDRRLFALLLVGGAAALTLPFVRSRIGFLFTDDFVEANLSGGRGGRKLNALMLFETCDPWLGLGHGMFGGAVAMQNKVLDHTDYFYVDNYFLKTMLETGYLGLTAFLSMVAGFVVTGVRAVARTAAQRAEKKSRLYPLVCGMFAGLCGVLMHCGFENIFEEPYMMVYFWTIAAMIVWAGFFSEETNE